MYRDNLPQLHGGLFLSDGGIETTLVFNEKIDLPYFAAFHLLRTSEGRRALQKCFLSYVEIAKKFNVGIVLETATWRANADWGHKLGYSQHELAEANRLAVRELEQIRQHYETNSSPIIISGCIGPRGDGYSPQNGMSVSDAEHYHAPQIETLSQTKADLVTAMTMNYVEEAIGIATVAKNTGIPVVISFTVEQNGKLPTGQTLGDAIRQVDIETDHYPSYYMINCAHPSYFVPSLQCGEPWLNRVRGLRANSSKRSHAELDEAVELDRGNPSELANDYAELRGSYFRCLSVMGGCCGTDHQHVEKIAERCVPFFK